MIKFEHYAKIRNNYCLCYLGYSDEYLFLLDILRPHIMNRFKNLNLFIACKDDKINLIKENGVKITELKKEKHQFAHVYEIRYNGQTHPIEDLLNECDINLQFKVPLKERTTNKCVLITEGAYPTIPLLKNEIKKYKKIALLDNYNVEINTDIKNASLVIGVESLNLFKAAYEGIPTILIDKGIGTQLYKKLFPNGKVMYT